MAATEDILTLEDSIHYIRVNFNDIYPPTKKRGKTMGSIPVELHKKMQGHANKHNLKMHEILAGLWDFYEQYETIHAEELKAQRARNKRR